jgi:hypothetical protein
VACNGGGLSSLHGSGLDPGPTGEVSRAPSSVFASDAVPASQPLRICRGHDKKWKAKGPSAGGQIIGRCKDGQLTAWNTRTHKILTAECKVNPSSVGDSKFNYASILIPGEDGGTVGCSWDLSQNPIERKIFDDTCIGSLCGSASDVDPQAELTSYIHEHHADLFGMVSTSGFDGNSSYNLAWHYVPNHPSKRDAFVLPHGSTWSDLVLNSDGTLKKLTLSEAKEACSVAGGRLPSQKEFDDALAGYGLRAYHDRFSGEWLDEQNYAGLSVDKHAKNYHFLSYLIWVLPNSNEEFPSPRLNAVVGKETFSILDASARGNVRCVHETAL